MQMKELLLGRASLSKMHLVYCVAAVMGSNCSTCADDVLKISDSSYFRLNCLDSLRITPAQDILGEILPE